MHTKTHAHPRHSPTRQNTSTETLHLCTNMHTHTYTHVYTCIRIHTHIQMHIHAYIHVRTQTYIHMHTHTHTTCTYARTHARLERWRGSDWAKIPTWCQEALHFSLVQNNQSHLAHPTHFLKLQYPSTWPPIFLTYPRTVHGPHKCSFNVPTLHVIPECTTLTKLCVALQWPLA